MQVRDTKFLACEYQLPWILLAAVANRQQNYFPEPGCALANLHEQLSRTLQTIR